MRLFDLAFRRWAATTDERRLDGDGSDSDRRRGRR